MIFLFCIFRKVFLPVGRPGAGLLRSRSTSCPECQDWNFEDLFIRTLLTFLFSKYILWSFGPNNPFTYVCFIRGPENVLQASIVECQSHESALNFLTTHGLFMSTSTISIPCLDSYTVNDFSRIRFKSQRSSIKSISLMYRFCSQVIK